MPLFFLLWKNRNFVFYSFSYWRPPPLPSNQLTNRVQNLHTISYFLKLSSSRHLTVSKIKVDKEFRIFSFLTKSTKSRGPEVIGQLTQSAISLACVGSSFVMSLSIKQIKGLQLIWRVVHAFGRFCYEQKTCVQRSSPWRWNKTS